MNLGASTDRFTGVAVAHAGLSRFRGIFSKVRATHHPSYLDEFFFGLNRSWTRHTAFFLGVDAPRIRPHQLHIGA
jgi:hypothetical protein